MKHLKQISAGLMAAVLMLTGSACGKTEDSAALANPVTEVSAGEQLAENTGIALEAPEGAESVSYAYIAAEGEEAAIAQVKFTLDGVDYVYRAQATSLTTLIEQSAGTLPDTAGVLEIGQGLCGLNDEFDNGATVIVQERDAFCTWTEGKSGFVVWLDAVPGILYTLSTSKGAAEDSLVSTAEAVFVPAQGEA